MSKQANLKEVQAFFEMSSGDFAKEWRELDPETKEWFKIEVGKVLGK